MKNVQIKIVVVATAAALLSACSEPAKSVQYFQAHQNEIASTLAECQKNVGAANCDSAGAASAIIQQQKWLATPPKRGVW